MSQYPRYSLAGGNQYPAVATAIPSQLPVIEIVDGAGEIVTNIGNGAADGTWITATPLNAWVAGATAPAYMKDSRGIVHCRGILQNGAAATVGINFPAGYRPYAASGAPGYYFHWNVAPHACVIDISGNLTVQTVGPINLGLIHFPTVLA